MAMSKALKDEIYKPYIHPKWRYAFIVCAKRSGREITALFDYLGEVVWVHLPCFFTAHLLLADLAAGRSSGLLRCGLFDV
jgi:hypothetical protein